MKDIPGYEGHYAATEDGRIWSHKSNKFLSASKCNGYMQVSLYKDGKKKTYQIHRLVALTYLPNPDNLPHVSHLDETRDNNHVSNLKWATAKENLDMPLRVERFAKAKRKRVWCLNNDIIYDSQTQAAQDLGISRTGISRVCKGIYYSISGYRFEYYDK